MRVKNLVTSFTASFDQIARRLENHEAVADYALADVRKAAAKLRLQAGRIQADVDRHAQALAAAEKSVERWQQRALAQSPLQEEQALECVRRAEQAKREAQTIAGQLTRCEALLAEVQSAQRDVESRLAELKLRKNALASRDSRVAAFAVSRDPNLSEEADAVFERWEHSILEKEYLEGSDATGGAAQSGALDRFEQEFERVERESALVSELAALRAKSKPEA